MKYTWFMTIWIVDHWRCKAKWYVCDCCKNMKCLPDRHETGCIGISSKAVSVHDSSQRLRLHGEDICHHHWLKIHHHDFTGKQIFISFHLLNTRCQAHPTLVNVHSNTHFTHGGLTWSWSHCWVRSESSTFCKVCSCHISQCMSAVPPTFSLNIPTPQQYSVSFHSACDDLYRILLRSFRYPLSWRSIFCLFT